MNIKLIAFIVIILSSVHIIENYSKVSRYLDNNSYVYFMDVGQGDSALIKTPNKDLILIDGGPDNSILFNLYEILPFWIKKIDLIIISHPHSDHINGIKELLKIYKAGCILHDISDEDIVGNYSHDFVEFQAKTIMEFSPQQQVSSCISDGVKIDTISYYDICNKDTPRGREEHCDLKNINNKSLVNKIIIGEMKLLFTGDIEKEMQKKLIGKINNVDILKVPHQGSFDSYNPDFIHNVKPEIAVISVGKDNKYGHPSEFVVSEYKKRFGALTLRTDMDGTIKIKYDGKNIIVIE